MLNKLLQKRRSTRTYTTQSVEKEKIEALLEAALRSPTGRNSREWHFVVVNDADMLKKLGAVRTYGSSFIEKATAAIVVCADNSKTTTWAEDCSIASYAIQLAAVDNGLSSCWVQIRNREHNAITGAEEYVRNLLQIPNSLRILSIIALGYAEEEKHGPAKEKLLWDHIHYDKFSADTND